MQNEIEEKDLKKEIIEDLKSKLDEYDGTSTYACDLAFLLFEGYNADGSITYNRWEAQEWVKKYFRCLGDVYGDLKDNSMLPDDLNLFHDAEKFQVIVYLEIASQVIGQCPTIKEHWDNKITLDKKLIKYLKKELDELNLEEE